MLLFSLSVSVSLVMLLGVLKPDALMQSYFNLRSLTTEFNFNYSFINHCTMGVPTYHENDENAAGFIPLFSGRIGRIGPRPSTNSINTRDNGDQDMEGIYQA
jgi:hypothetical protein